MPRYPDRKADKDALYDATVAGINANPALYPAGPGQPFNLTAMTALIATKNTARNTRQNEEGQFRNSVEAEENGYEGTDDEERRLLNVAIATHGADSPHLLLIGWAPRAEPTSNVPGQPRNLEAIIQGPGNLFLDWKAPAPAALQGRVAYYRVERRKRTLAGQQTEDWGAWQSTTTDSELSITDLERGVEYDFRVTAVNAAGDSIPSNLATVVL